MRDGKVAKTDHARELWEKVGYAAWACADPGMQFDTRSTTGTPARRPAPINAQQPVLGVHVPRRHGVQPGLFEPDQFRPRRRPFDVASFEHACRLWTMVLEISVLMAQFPSGDRASCPTSTAPSAWALPTSAAC
jgi:ribonucleoside-diphosphate reductase alpha chain